MRISASGKRMKFEHVCTSWIRRNSYFIVACSFDARYRICKLREISRCVISAERAGRDGRRDRDYKSSVTCSRKRIRLRCLIWGELCNRVYSISLPFLPPFKIAPCGPGTATPPIAWGTVYVYARIVVAFVYMSRGPTRTRAPLFFPPTLSRSRSSSLRLPLHRLP